MSELFKIKQLANIAENFGVSTLAVLTPKVASSEEEKEMVRNARENIPGIFLAAGNFRAAGTHGQFLAKMAGKPCMLADERKAVHTVRYV